MKRLFLFALTAGMLCAINPAPGISTSEQSLTSRSLMSQTKELNDNQLDSVGGGDGCALCFAIFGSFTVCVDWGCILV
jgi:hypothetical protein